MKYALAACVSIALVLACGGCPGNDNTNTGPIDAKITLSASKIEPGGTVAVGAGSTTSEAAVAAYEWDFGGDGTAVGETAQHTFAKPGLYTITLTVTDENGAKDTATADVQVKGQNPTAVISANPTSGVLPLAVQFDGSGSSAPDDEIHDYYWDFNDGTTTRGAKPVHIYTKSGSYAVTLRVVTGGGAENTATITIDVGAAAGHSLQFNGNQFVSLPVPTGAALSKFTFEVAAKPETAGGTIATFGSPTVTLSINPTNNTMRLQIGAASQDFSAFNTAGGWFFFAVAYDSTSGAQVYANGVPIGGLTTTGDISISQLTVGGGFRGNIAGSILWAATRTAAQIGADANFTQTGGETDLVGLWRMNEGSGQTVGNDASGGANGTLGSSAGVEASDPSWSNDSP